MTASAWHDEMERGGGFTWYTLNQIIDVTKRTLDPPNHWMEDALIPKGLEIVAYSV
ncbi:hypothetical protein FOPG_13465 [Fusarium oxysporum f. sp. conglutinans race 2 54008]|uniref:Uncharacterized protein n=1 Tax=Fusarium oxysporum f. sp. conglutinans race 2 54008 TaxID=1089457 RepID=X0HG42_FUSOX|nr:hypothetical protein FOPG_13465 [Fusarium oxysporum f. sp. conglutinans race 2 54008]